MGETDQQASLVESGTAEEATRRQPNDLHFHPLPGTGVLTMNQPSTASLPQEMIEFWGEPISVYTRAQAIEDGELVDVTEWASADKGFIGGFTCPVAMTRSVFAMCEPPKGSMQDLRGRAHDVLWMCRCAARGCRSDRLTFRVMLSRRYVTLRAVIDGDGITIMRPEED